MKELTFNNNKFLSTKNQSSLKSVSWLELSPPSFFNNFLNTKSKFRDKHVWSFSYYSLLPIYSRNIKPKTQLNIDIFNFFFGLGDQEVSSY